MSSSTVLDTLRRQRKRWLGSGPWHAQPFARVLANRHPAGSLHLAETADGEIATYRHPAMMLPSGHALLGQQPPSVLMESGEPRFREAGVAPAHTTRYQLLESAGVLGDDGLVYCPRQRAAVAETARTIGRPAGGHPELSHDRPVTGRLAGVSLLLAGPFGHAHYHLLWDLLGKLALLPATLRHGIDHYLVGVRRTPRIAEWLHTAGVPDERIVWLQGDSHLLCDQVIFSNLPCEVTQPRPAVRDALCRLLAAPLCTRPERWLWITRRGQATRDLTWEEAILAAFPRFERLDLGALPVRAQIEAFAAASVVAGPHGSGMANLAFVQGGGNLVEIFPEEFRRDPLFGRMAALVGWHHSWARVDFGQPAALDAVTAALKVRLMPA